VIQQTGITLNNSHLLRAAMAFAVIGVIGSGSTMGAFMKHQRCTGAATRTD